MTKKRYLTAEEIQRSGIDDNLLTDFNSQIPDTFFETDEYEDMPIPAQGGTDFYGDPEGYFTPFLTEEDKEYLLDPSEEAYITPDQLQDRKADSQSGLVQMALRGPWNTLVKVPQEVFKTVGSIGGLLGWLGTGADSNDMGIIFDNAFNRGIDTFFNAAKADVFVPTKVRDGSLLDNMGSTAFWASEGADALGFMASFFVGSGLVNAASRGLKIGAGIAQGANKVGAFSKTVSALGKAGAVIDDIGTATGKAAKLGGKIKGAEGAIDIATKAKNIEKLTMAIDRNIAVGVNTYAESVAEAGEVFREIKGDALKLGKTEEEANSIASRQATKDFLFNMALLSVTNGIEAANFFKTFDESKALFEGLSKAGIKGSKGLLAKNVAKRAVGSALSEGIVEEGSQSAAQGHFGNIENAGDLSTDIPGGLGEIYKTYVETLPETEMQKAMMLGAMLGVGGGVVGGTRKYRQSKEVLYGDAAASGLKKRIYNSTFIKEQIKKREKKGKGGYGLGLAETVLGPMNNGAGLKDKLNRSFLTDFRGLHSIYKKNEKGEAIMKEYTDEDGKKREGYEPSTAFVKKFGRDIATKFIRSDLMKDAIEKNNESAFEVLKAIQEFDMVKELLGEKARENYYSCLLYTSPSPRD